MNITHVSLVNFRGFTKNVAIGEKTLIVGPNGSGKSSILAAIEYALTGSIEGLTKEQIAEGLVNSSMTVAVHVDGHIVERTLRAGESLKETVRIDGEKVKVTDAKVQLAEIIGDGLKVMAVRKLFELGPKERRYAIMEALAEPGIYEALAKEEKEARTELNASRARRQGAEKSLKQLTESMVEQDLGGGDAEQLAVEIRSMEDAITAANENIARGEANDKARENIGKASVQIEEAEKAIKDVDGKVQEAGKELEALEGREEPEPEKPRGISGIPEEVISVIRKARSAISVALDVWRDNCEERTGLADAIGALTDILPSQEEQDKYVAEFAAWSRKETMRQDEYRKLEKTVNKLTTDKAKAEQKIESAQKWLDSQADIGPGLDENDIKARDGMLAKKTELQGTREIVREREAVHRELERARVTVGKEEQAEEAAKQRLATAIEDLTALEEGINKTLDGRDLESLPTVVFDGDSASLVSDRDGLMLSRAALSSGERALFDAAAGHALTPDGLVIVEAGEVDDMNLCMVLYKLSSASFQMIVASWHLPTGAPTEGWTSIVCDG